MRLGQRFSHRKIYVLYIYQSIPNGRIEELKLVRDILTAETAGFDVDVNGVESHREEGPGSGENGAPFSSIFCFFNGLSRISFNGLS
jgi:hypothetical protein